MAEAMSLNHDPSDTASDRPRIGLVVVDDGLYTHRWATPVLNCPDFRSVCVACLSPFWAVNFNPGGKRGFWPVSRARLAYYGPSATLKFAFSAAATKLSELRFRLGLGGRPGSVASAARARGVEVLRPLRSDLRDAVFRSRLKGLHLDLLVCAFSQRTDQAFLDLPRMGCLNVHFSLLPQHRGREPLFHAMLAGQGAGVSAHWMGRELDSGPVVVQESLDATGFLVLHQLILAACDLAARVVPAAIVKASSQPRSEFKAAPLLPMAGWPSPEEVGRFKANGARFI
jgi:hypothetical protein